jgi:hypothetical protein
MLQVGCVDISATHMAVAQRGFRAASSSTSFARLTAVWLPPAVQPQQSLAAATQSRSARQAICAAGRGAPALLPGAGGPAAARAGVVAGGITAGGVAAGGVAAGGVAAGGFAAGGVTAGGVAAGGAAGGVPARDPSRVQPAAPASSPTATDATARTRPAHDILHPPASRRGRS